MTIYIFFIAIEFFFSRELLLLEFCCYNNRCAVIEKVRNKIRVCPG